VVAKTTSFISRKHRHHANYASYLRQDAPLKAHHCDQHGKSKGPHTILLQKCHQVAKTDEHHDLNASKELVGIKKLVVFQEGLPGQRGEQDHQTSLHHKQPIRSSS
jgi:hypothetical protein